MERSWTNFRRAKKAAEATDGTAALTAKEDRDMDRTALITKLSKCKYNPIQDIKALEAFSDEGLRMLDGHCSKTSDAFKALEDELQESTTRIETLEAAAEEHDTQVRGLQAELRTAKRAPKEMSEEDWFKAAPESVRSLVEKQRQQDEEKKADLVESLKAAQDAYTEDELKAMSLVTLEKHAKMLKLDEPAKGDFSTARPAPRMRAAGEADVYLNPPDPYAEGVKKLQTAYGRNVN
jgi:leucyl-tRNA synthetase